MNNLLAQEYFQTRISPLSNGKALSLLRCEFYGPYKLLKQVPNGYCDNKIPKSFFFFPYTDTASSPVLKSLFFYDHSLSSTHTNEY